MRIDKRQHSLLCLCLAGLLGVVFTWPTSVHAQAGKELSARQKKQARKLAKDAAEHKRAADRLAGRKRAKQAKARYRKAAVAYLEVYELTEAPAFLAELGAVYQARGELAWARRVYKKYLELAPNASTAARVEQALTDVEELLAGDTNAGQAIGDAKLDPTSILGPEPEPEPEPSSGDESGDESGSGDDDTDSANTGDDAGANDSTDVGPRKSRPKRPGQLFKWSGIGAGATGVAFISLGVVFGLDARSKANTLSANLDAWTPEDRALVDSGESSETKMIIFTSLGVALAAGGAVAFYLGMQKDKAATTAADRAAILIPRLTSDSATITLTGWF